MPRFAANLTMMYNEHAFLDRFAAAAQDGFEAVEFLFPYDFRADEMKARLDAHGLTQALFNAPPGDWAGGERGIASLPGREDEFRAQRRDRARLRARARQSQAACDGRPDRRGSIARQTSRGVSEESRVCREGRAGRTGITVVIEPINTRDMPGFFLTVRTTRKRSARKSARRI